LLDEGSRKDQPSEMLLFSPRACQSRRDGRSLV